jgi:hypothetical protein
MKRKLTQADAAKKQPICGARNGRRLVSSTLLALLVASTSLTLNDSYAFAASDAATTPGNALVSERNHVENVHYLDGQAREVKLPNGMSDIAIQQPDGKKGLWYLPLFSKGTIRVSFVDFMEDVVTFPSGAKVRLVDEPTNGSWKYDIDKRIYVRGDGARFGYETFELPTGIKDKGLRCGDVGFGVVRLDAAGKPLWRKTYVKLQNNVPEDDWGICGHSPHQAQVLTQGQLVGFGDDTIGILIGDTLIRVSAESGMPVGPLSDVKVFDSEKVAAARAERYSKVFGDGDKAGPNAEAEYYKLETDFFFQNNE